MKQAVNFHSGRPFFDEPGPDFATFGVGRRLLYLRRDFASAAPSIFARLSEISVARTRGAGNRGSGFAFEIDGVPTLFARRGRRGGLVRLLLRDLFLGIQPRPVRELAVATEARRRGIPIAEPVGALVEWVGPMLYRGMFITRALSGMTLWEFVRTDDDATVRTHVVSQMRRAIDSMHQMGLWHADLNLFNLFVSQAGESFAPVILDLDKARLFRGPLHPRYRRSNFDRLLRSAHKLDPQERFLDHKLLEILTA
jgi:3-deoxy-D-manno-octulosonic acid kinase